MRRLALSASIFALCLFAISSLFFPLVSHATPNLQINYQGKLTDELGVVVDDGTYSMTFALYSLSMGGTSIWEEPQDVTVVSGLFSVILGSIFPITDDSFGTDFNQTLYLGVKVGADAEMTPRKIITSVPSAINAFKLDGLTSSQFMRIYVNGNAGIGTTTPYAKLSVVGQTVSEYFTATSTTIASTFPYASTTMLTAVSLATSNLTGLSGSLNISTIGDNPLNLISGNNYIGYGAQTSSNFNHEFSGSVNMFNSVILASSSGGVSIGSNLSSVPDHGLGVTGDLVVGGTISSTIQIKNFQNDSKVILNSSGDSYLIGGKIGIGTTTPISTLSIQGSLCVRDTGSCDTTAGTIYATNASVSDIDLAENYLTNDDTLVAGEIVAVDTSTPESIKRATAGDRVMGVISTKPGFLLGQGLERTKAVALAGRVPVRVSLGGGDINIGDYLSLSTQPGVAMKTGTSTTSIIGTALSSYTAAQGHQAGEVGTVVMFVMLHNEPLSEQVSGGKISSYFSFDETTGKLKALVPIDLNNQDLLNVRSIISTNGAWKIDENGVLTSTEVHTNKLCIGSTCVEETQFRDLLNHAGITSTTFTPPIIETSTTTATTTDSSGSVSTTTPTGTATTAPEVPPANTQSTTTESVIPPEPPAEEVIHSEPEPTEPAANPPAETAPVETPTPVSDTPNP